MSETIKQYRKKPAVVDAVQVGLENLEVLTKWCGRVSVEYLGSDLFAMRIPNHETGDDMVANFGDYIVRGEDGLRYFSAAEFAETFEVIDEGVEPDEPVEEEPPTEPENPEEGTGDPEV